ncbi:MAG: hypothetical protein CM15mP103_00170 [Gammaproteobacteria bacterium]|nr:MAG: hypothetical protein CM15mP103_00170 [Gammaproteobacteria bacterium]
MIAKGGYGAGKAITTVTRRTNGLRHQLLGPRPHRLWGQPPEDTAKPFASRPPNNRSEKGYSHYAGVGKITSSSLTLFTTRWSLICVVSLW